MQPARPAAAVGLGLPADLASACDRRAPPEEQFRAAEAHFEPAVVATMLSPPFSGAPLLGHPLHVAGSFVLINGFKCIFCEGTAKREVFLGLDDLIKLDMVCMSKLLARSMGMVDAERGRVALQQCEGVAGAAHAFGRSE